MELEQTVNLNYIKLDEIDKKIDNVIEKCEDITVGSCEGTSSTLNSINTKVTNIDTKTNNISNNIDSLIQNVNNISSDLTTMESTLRGTEEVNLTGIYQNVMAANNNLSLNLNSTLIAISGIMGEDLVDLTTLKGENDVSLTDINNSINNIPNNDYSENLTNITTIANNNNSLLSSIDSNINTINTKIDTIDNNVLSLVNNGGNSSGESGNSNCDLSEIEKDLKLIKYKLNTLIHDDSNYIPKDVSDYPAGTIFKTYDVDERDLYLTTTSTLSLPKIHFCAEPESTGSVKIAIDFTLKTTLANIYFTTTLNNEVICSEEITVSELGVLNRYEKTFNVNFNPENKGNNIVVSLRLESVTGTKNLTISKQKIEVFAPNADIINKLCNFDAVYLADDKYHIADCTSGQAKIAEIMAKDMNNYITLIYTDTNIDTYQYKFFSIYKDFSTVFKYEGLGYLYLGKNNKYCYGYGDFSTESSAETYCYDWQDKYEIKVYFMRLQFGNHGSGYEIYNPQKNVISESTSTISSIDGVKTIGMRFLHGRYNATTGFPNCCLVIDANGKVNFLRDRSTIISSIDLGYGTDATIYLTHYVNGLNYDLEIYIKRFDKIIKYIVHCAGSNNYSIVSTSEVGSYEKFFKMPNNDYFVIKNNKLEYYKEPIVEEE